MPPEVKTSGTASKKVKRTKTVGINGKRKKGGSADSGKMDATSSDKSPDEEDVASILLQFKRST